MWILKVNTMFLFKTFVVNWGNFLVTSLYQEYNRIVHKTVNESQGNRHYCSEGWEQQLLCSNQFRDDKDLSSVTGRTPRGILASRSSEEATKVVRRSQEICLSQVRQLRAWSKAIIRILSIWKASTFIPHNDLKTLGSSIIPESRDV